MTWSYTDAGKTIVTDGLSSIPLNSETGESRRLKTLMEAGLDVADYVAPIAINDGPTFSPRQVAKVIQALIARGIVQPPNEA